MKQINNSNISNNTSTEDADLSAEEKARRGLISLSLSLYIYICIYLCMYIYIYMYTYIYICMCVYTYVCVYVYIHIYTHICAVCKTWHCARCCFRSLSSRVNIVLRGDTQSVPEEWALKGRRPVRQRQSGSVACRLASDRKPYVTRIDEPCQCSQIRFATLAEPNHLVWLFSHATSCMCLTGQTIQRQ